MPAHRTTTHRTTGDTAAEPRRARAEGPRLRRRSLLGLGLAGAGAVAMGGAARAGAAPPPLPAPRPDKPPAAPGLFSREETLLAFRNHGMHLEFLDQPITPVASHYQLHHFDVPQLSAAGYSITIGGRVARPRTISLRELVARPAVRQASVLECAGTGRAYLQPRPVYVPWFDEAMGAFEYTGTPLGPLLDEAGLLGDAVEVVFTGHDEGCYDGIRHAFERSLPIQEARADGVLLAWAANGEPLTPAHGFPLRLVVPSWYGMASVKWLRGITVIDHPFQGVEQVDAYRMRFSPSERGSPVQRKHVRAAMKPPGIPDLLSRARFVDAGAVPLAGMAWSGFGGIAEVEVSADDRRTWRPAVLGRPASPHTWTPWHCTWRADPGEHVLSVRATDTAGHTQPLDPFWNYEGNAQNAVQRVPVRVS